MTTPVPGFILARSLFIRSSAASALAVSIPVRGGVVAQDALGGTVDVLVVARSVLSDPLERPG